MGSSLSNLFSTNVIVGTSTVILVGMAGTLIPPILWPTVISYPWKMPDASSEREKDKQKTVVLAGSFNPPHNGHLAMLEYLSQRYGKVLVVVGVNPNKKYLVQPEERVELLQSMIQSSSDSSNIQVQVVSGLIWRFAKREGATVFFRGIRSWEKDGAEERSLQILNTWGPLLLGPTWPLPTLYLQGKPEYNRISSTLIRDLCQSGTSPTESLSKLVPTAAAERVAELYNRKED